MSATIDQPIDHSTLVLLDVAQEPLRKRIAELEAENAALSQKLDIEVTAKRAALGALGLKF